MKKFLLFLIIFSIFFLLCSGIIFSNSQEKVPAWLSGNEYVNLEQSKRIYYLQGTMDTIFFRYEFDHEANKNLFPDEEHWLADYTEGMTIGQIDAIFIKYLKEHPELWHCRACDLFFLCMSKLQD